MQNKKIPTKITVKGFSTAEARWARLGQYYAMFPLDFALEVIKSHSNIGGGVIDPFAGRGTSIYAAGLLGRRAIGIEISPLGWLYGSVKLNPAPQVDVIARLSELYEARYDYKSAAKEMSPFFHQCFNREVLCFLLAARDLLNWKKNRRDATLMALLLHYLHGRRGSSLSNQMQLTKAMGIEYSLKWWKLHNMEQPPEINPMDFILQRINWRYQHGTPQFFGCSVRWGDSTKILPAIAKKKLPKEKYQLLLTSPPYYSITDYHADQWLRLWLLGGHEQPTPQKEKHKGRFGSKVEYRNLLDQVFAYSAEVMDDNCMVYVRTDSRKYTFDTTLELLKKHFPKHRARIKEQPFKKKSQTELYGNKTNARGEVDIIMSPSRVR